MFRVNPRVTVGLIFFTNVIQKFEKQWKLLGHCLEYLPMEGPSGNQTFLWGCGPQEGLTTLGLPRENVSDNLFGLSIVCTIHYTFPPLVFSLHMDSTLGPATERKYKLEEIEVEEFRAGGQAGPEVGVGITTGYCTVNLTVLYCTF